MACEKFAIFRKMSAPKLAKVMCGETMISIALRSSRFMR